jgi:hypothetical protein
VECYFFLPGVVVLPAVTAIGADAAETLPVHHQHDGTAQIQGKRCVCRHRCGRGTLVLHEAFDREVSAAGLTSDPHPLSGLELAGRGAFEVELISLAPCFRCAGSSRSRSAGACAHPHPHDTSPQLDLMGMGRLADTCFYEDWTRRSR